MNDETWIALQRRCLPRALPVVTQTSSDDWLVVDERETVVAVISPETYWETNDPSTAQTRAYLIAAAKEMAALLREIAQLPPLLDGTNRSAVVISDDLRRRIHEVRLKINGFTEWPY